MVALLHRHGVVSVPSVASETNLLLLSSSDELDPDEYLLTSGDMQSGNDKIELSGE